MGKQAILITAYRDEENLLRLVNHFSDDSSFRVLVHIDKKCKEIDVGKVMALGGGGGGNNVICRYDIVWGSINHLFAVLDLMKLAMVDSEVEYVHLISGSDMPTKTAKWFVERFSACQESFVDFECKGHVRGREDWYCKWHLPSTWHFKGLTRLDRIFLELQRKLHIHRRMIGEVDVEALSSGLIWGSFSRKMCEEFIGFAALHPKFLACLNTTTIPEEAYIASVAFKSGLSCSEKGYGRYSVWSRERGNPAFLDERDYEAIVASECFFARKVDSCKSRKLLDRVYKEISSW